MNQNFDHLVQNVSMIHEATSTAAKGAVNQMLTVRNWIIGRYIVEYEQHGMDRAAYGTSLLQKLAERAAIKGMDRQMLNTCRLFYQRYPQICDSVNRRLSRIVSAGSDAMPALPENSLKTVSDGQKAICDSASRKFEIDPEILITKLSFTHIRKILPIDDPLERFFYELEYNGEQDRATIEKTFMDLMGLVKEISEEEQRYVREGFSSDEELSIYDLLFSESLSKSDIDKIKKLSTELLRKIKGRIAEMDHWTDKDETRATVQNLIRDELYMNIPDSMFDQLDHYREVIYEYVYTHYKEAA